MKTVWKSRVVLLSFFVFCSAVLAVDTRPIDEVRRKSVLSEADLVVIDDFIKNAITELVNTTDFTSVARLRAVIVSRRSDQTQYAQQFSESSFKYISQALEESEQIEPLIERIKVRTNLLILIDELGESQLRDLAVHALDDDSTVVRYWAVRALTGGRTKADEKVLNELTRIATDAPPEVISVILDYLARLGDADNPQAKKLLLDIADNRIEKYANWQVREHLLDIKLLKILCDNMLTGNNDAKQFGSRFAQLYSYAMQKYIMDINGGNFLDDDQRYQLVSLLVDIEDKCIGRLTGLQQTVIKRAIEENDPWLLKEEHSRLLGSTESRGVIPEKFDFYYGQAEDGTKLTSPRALSEPPNAS